MRSDGSAGRPVGRTGDEDRQLRRLATQVVVQLPEEEGAALEVLRLAGELVRTFLNAPTAPGEAPEPDERVVRLC